MKKLVYSQFLRLKYLKYRNVFRKFKNYTMIPEKNYYLNLKLCERFSAIKGSIVECGTWKGGMIAGIAQTIGQDRNFVLFDSFEGLPLAKEIDGKEAISWQSDKNSPTYFNNCTASEHYAIEAMKISGVKNVSIVKGWFNDTLSKHKFNNGIAILRMDGDWYESTMDIMNSLFPLVNKGGLIIIDDYFTWEGCAKAVNDYLLNNNRPEQIKTFGGRVCYIIKK